MNATTARFQDLANQAKTMLPARDGDAVETRSLMRAFWAYRVQIAGLSLTAGLLIWLVMLQVTPTYTVYAKAMLDVRKAQIVARNEVVADVNPNEQVVNSEIQVLRSSLVISGMLDRLSAAQVDQIDPALAPPSLRDRAKTLAKRLLQGRPAPLSPEAEAAARQARLIDAVRGMRRAYAEPDSYVMTVRVDAEDPALATAVANGLVDSYIDLQLQHRRDSVGQATVWLEQRLDELRIEVEAAERRVAEFQSVRLIEDGGTLDTVSQQLSDLNSELADLRTARVEAEARLDQLLTVLRNGTFEAAARIVDTPTMQELATQQLELKQNDAVWARTFDADHPRRTENRVRQEEILAVMQVELENAIAVQQSEVGVARSRETGLEASIAGLEGKVLAMTDNQLGLRQLNREADAARQTYEQLLVRIAEARAQRELQQPDSVLVEHALEPSVPTQPRPKLMAALGMTIAAALASAWVLFSEMSPTTFRATRELEAATGLPVLAALPDEGWSGVKDMIDHLDIDPYSFYAERIRHLRAALTLSEAEPGRGQSVVFLASSPGEGKTTTALALAQIVALSGRSAIVVDADLRRPQVLAALGIAREVRRDFADYIEGTCDLNMAICEPSGFGFDVLGARKRRQSAADALSGHLLRPMLRELEALYDFVIVDAPAVLAVPDALALARETATRFYVVESDTTPRTSVDRGLATLSEMGISIRGLVLNKVDPRRTANSLEEDYGYGY